MALLRLEKSPIPPGDTTQQIESHATKCHTCWNLYAGSLVTAIELHMLGDNVARSHKAARKPQLHTEGQIPCWAGEDRADLDSYQFDIHIADIASSFGRCDTCRLLAFVVGSLSQKIPDFSDYYLCLQVILGAGHVLRLNLLRQDSRCHEDWYGINAFSLDSPASSAGFWELYTLPGKSAPASTVLC
jgi:hypothetical protein